MPDKRPIRVIDSTMRDGSHAMAHQFTLDQIESIARALDESGVSTMEISHGDGMGGASYNYGFPKVPEQDWLRTAANVVKNAQLAILLIPGIGTQEHLESAYEIGARVARIATHCTEADIAQQHIGLARELGMETIGFLMLSHMISAEALLEQAKLMESYGAQCVYVVDSAGAMLPDDYRRKVSTLRAGLDVA
ncbi:MAG: 4-hydroxy-2-oxovalerate aldolase, partial [Dehalococcoidia bacterium]